MTSDKTLVQGASKIEESLQPLAIHLLSKVDCIDYWIPALLLLAAVQLALTTPRKLVLSMEG